MIARLYTNCYQEHYFGWTLRTSPPERVKHSWPCMLFRQETWDNSSPSLILHISARHSGPVIPTPTAFIPGKDTPSQFFLLFVGKYYLGNKPWTSHPNWARSYLGQTPGTSHPTILSKHPSIVFNFGRSPWISRPSAISARFTVMTFLCSLCI